MKNNLLSMGQLLAKGFTMHMEDDHLEVYDSSSKKILSAHLAENKTFQVRIKPAGS